MADTEHIQDVAASLPSSAQKLESINEALVAGSKALLKPGAIVQTSDAGVVGGAQTMAGAIATAAESAKRSGLARAAAAASDLFANAAQAARQEHLLANADPEPTDVPVSAKPDSSYLKLLSLGLQHMSKTGVKGKNVANWFDFVVNKDFQSYGDPVGDVSSRELANIPEMSVETPKGIATASQAVLEGLTGVSPISVGLAPFLSVDSSLINKTSIYNNTNELVDEGIAKLKVASTIEANKDGDEESQKIDEKIPAEVKAQEADASKTIDSQVANAANTIRRWGKGISSSASPVLTQAIGAATDFASEHKALTVAGGALAAGAILSGVAVNALSNEGAEAEQAGRTAYNILDGSFSIPESALTATNKWEGEHYNSVAPISRVSDVIYKEPLYVEANRQAYLAATQGLDPAVLFVDDDRIPDVYNSIPGNDESVSEKDRMKEIEEIVNSNTSRIPNII